MELKRLLKFANGLDKAVIKGIDKTLDKMLVRVKELTPIDTGELIGNYKKKLNRSEKKGTIENNTEHAGYIEFGTRYARNYHKNGIKFRSSGDFQGKRGARMMTQTRDEFKDEFRDFIVQSINGEIVKS